MDEEDRIIIAKPVAPTRRDRTGPYAVALVAAFLLTYGLVMFGDRLGILPGAQHPVNAADVPSPATVKTN